MFYLLSAAVIAALSLSPGSTATSEPDADTRARAVVVTSAPALQVSLKRLWEGSPSWRAAVARIAAEDRGRVVVLTPDQVVVRQDGKDRVFDSDLLAEVSPVTGVDGRVRQVLVVVNLELIEGTHDRLWNTPRDLQADLDRVLAHEVFGHALPYLLAGDLSGHCADPAPGERAIDACAIQRENVIRAELGLGRRTDAGLHGLTLARRTR